MLTCTLRVETVTQAVVEIERTHHHGARHVRTLSRSKARISGSTIVLLGRGLMQQHGARHIDGALFTARKAHLLFQRVQHVCARHPQLRSTFVGQLFLLRRAKPPPRRHTGGPHGIGVEKSDATSRRKGTFACIAQALLNFASRSLTTVCCSEVDRCNVTA